jgi:hypothetical protein
MVAIERPANDECSSYYLGYVARVPECDVLVLLSEQLNTLDGLLRGLTDEQADYRFAPNEWSIKEVVGHLIDAERIFAYRAFTISRDESAIMPGIDPDVYVAAGHYGARSLAELLDELAHLRRANLLAFRHLTTEATRRRGVASDTTFSVRALIYIIAGHVNYHLADLREKYLPGLAKDE